MSAYVHQADHIDFIVTRMVNLADVHAVRVYLSDVVGTVPPGGWEKIPMDLIRKGPFGHDFFEVDHTTATVAGMILLEENVASVKHRYPDDDVTELPGPTELLEQLVRYQWAEAGSDQTPEGAIKAVHSYQYQSCEHPGWKTSLAKQLTDSLVESLVRTLPAYQSADTWNYTR